MMNGAKYAMPAALMLATGSAYAGMNSDEESRPMFKELDRDGDGRITQDEADENPGLARRFDPFDANGDGVLTREEFRGKDRSDSSG